MNFDDDRVNFYLKHRDQIEEWAALRAEAAAAVNAWLMELRPELEGLASNLGADVGLTAPFDDDPQWRAFYLFRASWPQSTKNEPPPTAICLEWDRKRVVLRGSDAPFVGIRAPSTHPVGAAVREIWRNTPRETRKWQSGQLYPAYRHVLPTRAFPEYADDYRRVVLDALGAAWKECAAIIDAAAAKI